MFRFSSSFIFVLISPFCKSVWKLTWGVDRAWMLLYLVYIFFMFLGKIQCQGSFCVRWFFKPLILQSSIYIKHPSIWVSEQMETDMLNFMWHVVLLVLLNRQDYIKVSVTSSISVIFCQYKLLIIVTCYVKVRVFTEPI